MIEVPQNQPDPDGHPPDDRKERRLLATVVSLVAAMTALAGVDALLDVRDHIGVQHAAVEECIFVLGLVGLFTLGSRLLRSMRREGQLRRETRRLAERLVETEQVLRAEAEELAARLALTEHEAARWKQEAGGLLAGLGAAIDAQFSRWGLSPAEREIGLLLLKGLSHKEIAQVRSVGEATVRQQAQRLYRKANIGSRNDLAAFFLEDLLLPGSGTRDPHERTRALGPVVTRAELDALPSVTPDRAAKPC